MSPWTDDGDGYQTHTCSCGHRVVAAITTSGQVDVKRCRCGEAIPQPSAQGPEPVPPSCDT